jgi:hypothetical protein
LTSSKYFRESVQGGVGLGGSDVGEISGSVVAVGGVSALGVGVRKETLTAAVGEASCRVGGINSVGVAFGPQADNRQKNTQYEIQSMYRVLRIRGSMVN